MAFQLGREAMDWNDNAKDNDKLFYAVRSAHYDRLHCQLPSEISASELRVLTAITGRTLRFKKYADAIPANVFCNGLRDTYEPEVYVKDNEGTPYFAGCGIKKPDTIYKAVEGLEKKDLITVWRPTRSMHANVYMPFSKIWLATMIGENKGCLPETLPCWIPGEIVTYQDSLARIDGRVDDETLSITPIDHWFQPTGDQFAVETRHLTRIDKQKMESVRMARKTPVGRRHLPAILGEDDPYSDEEDYRYG